MKIVNTFRCIYTTTETNGCLRGVRGIITELIYTTVGGHSAERLGLLGMHPLHVSFKVVPTIELVATDFTFEGPHAAMYI